MGMTVRYKGNTIASMSEDGTKTLLTSGKYCEGNITVDLTLPNYRRYEGTIATDVVGQGMWALLLTSDVIAAHYNDATLRVAIRFTPNVETAYTVLQVTGFNVGGQEPERFPSEPNVMQYTFRETSSVGSFNTNIIYLPVNSTDTTTNTVGRIRCDAQGHLYVMSGSNNYGVRAGTFVAEITW